MAQPSYKSMRSWIGIRRFISRQRGKSQHADKIKHRDTKTQSVILHKTLRLCVSVFIDLLSYSAFCEYLPKLPLFASLMLPASSSHKLNEGFLLWQIQ